MKESNAYDLRFTVVDLDDTECLFTESRVSTNTVPLPFQKYEVRYADEGGRACIAESVGERFLGTLISKEPLDFNGWDVRHLDEGEIDFYAGPEKSLAAFAQEHCIETKPRSGKSTRSIGLVEFSDDFAGDPKYGYHLSFDGLRLMKDGDYFSEAHEKRLQTDQFAYFTYEDSYVMFSVSPDGSIDDLVSNNYFAETAFLESMENILTRAGKERAVYLDDYTRPYMPEFVRDYEWEVPGENALKISYYDVETQGTHALYTERTISPDTVPKALHVYEVDQDPANPDGKLRLSKRAYVNFQGTLIAERPLDLGADGEIYLDPKDVSLRSDTPTTLKRFARECGLRVKPPEERER